MERSTSYSGRIEPAALPLDPDVQQAIDEIMRGNPPLRLFITMARDRRLFFRYFGGGLLDRGNLTLRQREIVIDRTTALCHAEYEWGVHVTTFAGAANLTDAQLASLTHGRSGDDCWNDEDRILIDLCDQLHHRTSIDDELWRRLSTRLTDEAILELLLLAGFYHSTSYIVNALHLPLEPGMARFADYTPSTRKGARLPT
jgi:alkylhydroperoxidase family enzyme